MEVGARRKNHLRLLDNPTWHFRLYISGVTPKSAKALENIRQFCDETLRGRYKIEVIDVSAQPLLALRENIVALPMLVREEPKPIRKVIGDLSNKSRLLAGMEVPPPTPEYKPLD